MLYTNNNLVLKTLFSGKTECDKQKEKLEEVSTPIINKIYEDDEKKTEGKGQKKKDEENEDDEAEVKDEL